MDETERMEVKILGRVIGIASGWDQADTHAVQFYDFEPAPGVALVSSTCQIVDFESGSVYSVDDEGRESNRLDIVDIVKPLEWQP